MHGERYGLLDIDDFITSLGEYRCAHWAKYSPSVREFVLHKIMFFLLTLGLMEL